MTEMTSRERYARIFAHQEADRVPMIDGPWDATIERWQREGMPKEVSYVDYFGLDHVAGMSLDNSPRYEERVIEDTPEYSITTSKWGVTLKNWKHAASTPAFLAHTIIDRTSWQAAKARITPSATASTGRR